MSTNSEITILSRGKNWLAVDKPAGLSIHNEPGRDLLSLLRKESAAGEEVHPVNRLDKGTSGIVLLALNHEMAGVLGTALAEREIQKGYLGITGRIPGAALETPQLWEYSLSRKAESRRNPRGLTKDRVTARTEWMLLKVNKSGALLKMAPLTGRRHQLRRHAAIAGLPLLGDKRYGPKGKGTGHFIRLGLHAQYLRFADPDSRRAVEIVSHPGDDFWMMMEWKDLPRGPANDTAFDSAQGA